MASPDIWRDKIIPRLDRFVSGPLFEVSLKQIQDKPDNQTLGFAVCRVVIAESNGVAEGCKKLDLGDFVPETINFWFPYAAVAAHLATRLEQGAKLGTPLTEEYYGFEDQIRPSEAAVQMLRWSQDTRNLTTLMAVDPTGTALVEFIDRSREYFRRAEDARINANNPTIPPPDVINKMVSLGATRFNKYIEHFFFPN